MPTIDDPSNLIAQAQGMVSVQAECSMENALAMMHERAQVQHQTLIEIAHAVLDRTIQFGL